MCANLFGVEPQESIRGIRKPYLRGNLDDFLMLMRVMGYEYEVIGRKLIYRTRDEFFRKDVVGMEFTAEEVGGLIIFADDKHAYSSVQIGYEKQDYESTNGRYEANTTVEYTTDYTTTLDNPMSWICPYRADSIGFELLPWERYDETKDTASDNNIFILAVKENDTAFAIYRDIQISSGMDDVKMFNAPLHPYFLMKANESILGINNDSVRFAGTDGNKEALIEGYDIYSDLTIEKKLFEPIRLNFASGSFRALPDEEQRKGLIYFPWRGKTYRGFIQVGTKNYGKETETTWDLSWVK